MASCNIEKTKSYQKVSAVLLHNSKDTRKNHAHSNKHIDVNKTDNNISMDRLSYSDRYKKFRKRLDETKEIYEKNHPKSADRILPNANIGLFLELPVPDDLAKNDIKYMMWCNATYDVLREHYGEENIICGDIHVDEIHDYIDVKTGKKCTSRPHMHVLVVPAVKEDCIIEHKRGQDENGNPIITHDKHYAGELCLDAVYTRKNTHILNDSIDQMTHDMFGCRWNTGEKSKSYAEMDELKAASAKLEREQAEERLKELKKDIKDLTTKRDKLEKRIEKLSADESARQKSLANAEKRLDTVNKHIENKQSELDALQSVINTRKSEIDEELGEYKSKKKSKIDEKLEKYEKEQREKADEKAKAEAAEQQKIISEQARTIIEQQQQIKQLDESIAEKQKADEYYQERIDENWKKNMEYVRENARLTKENAQLQGANHKMQLWYDFVGDKQAADMAFADYCQKMDGAAGSKLAKHNNISQRSQQQQQSQYDRGLGD